MRYVLNLLFLGLLALPNACLGAEPSAPERSDDTELRQRIVGVWEDNYQGHRIMTVRPDGTGTMVVKLKGWKATLYASRLEFYMTWSIRNGRMQKQTTGGEPSGKVKAILKMMGDRVDEPILELTEERLVLLDEDGKRRYEWRRVKTDTAKSAPSK